MGDTSYKLMHAVRKVREGKLDSVRELISSPRLHYSEAWSQEGYVLLLEAVKYKQNYIAKLLLACGCKVNKNKSTENSNTPLHFAVLHGDIDIVDMLLDRGANINAKAEENIIDYLMDKGEGYTPLHLAVRKGREEIIKLLLNRGANVNAKGKGGITPLHIAVQLKYLQIVEHLLYHGAYVDPECTSFHYWVYTIAWKLNTPLQLAVQMGWKEAVKLLLNRGAIINKTQPGSNALYIAIHERDKELLEILLKYGGQVDFMFNSSLLHVAVGTGNSEIVEVLLTGADIDSKDKDGRTALHIAVANSYKEIVQVLLKFDADIDSKDKFGRTVLHYASNHSYSSIVRILLEHGYDINVTCKNNLTPLDLALTCSNWGSENKTKVLKRHIIKRKNANLYVSKKNLLSNNSEDEIKYKDLQNQCEKEVASMKSEKINNVNVSFYDILTEDINKLAMYAGNESIAQILRSEDYEIKFPIYASMINSNFRKGERRREILEQCNKIFHLFYINFGLPQECTEEIFSYLSEKDLRILFSAY